MTYQLSIRFKVAFGQNCPINRARILVLAVFGFAAKQKTQQVVIPNRPVTYQYFSQYVLVHCITFHLIINNLNAISRRQSIPIVKCCPDESLNPYRRFCV